MKKQTKINYILTLILVFCIGASIPVLTGSSQVTEQHSAKSEVPYCVTSPTVPAQVTFDGETIDLRRYDRRERMDSNSRCLSPSSCWWCSSTGSGL